MEKLTGLRHLEPAEQQRLNWFIDSLDDPQLRSLILSSSIAKLAEFTGDANGWINWPGAPFLRSKGGSEPCS